MDGTSYPSVMLTATRCAASESVADHSPTALLGAMQLCSYCLAAQPADRVDQGAAILNHLMPHAVQTAGCLWLAGTMDVFVWTLP
jgi:hypothetical protein